jgi:glycosyltransferase involved in cell wall biosynthesis
VSVVVSTYNRPAQLVRLIDSLRAQTLDAGQFEVIVVDNGSGPDTGAVLAEEVRRGGLQLRTERHERTRGPAGGRNSGWSLARAPLIAFTDDDCIPGPSWLEAGLAAAGRFPGAIVQGRTLPARSAPGPMSHTVRVERLGPQYETCNIFYPRAVLESLGGFDESFGLQPAGEDTDLAWRALDSGVRAEFAPNALVHHEVIDLGLRGSLRLAGRWGDVARVFASHPGARSMLYRGYFWTVWHYLMWRSLVALLGPAWMRRMVLTLHLLELRKRARGFGVGPSAIPFFVVHDLVECWAIARGAVRHRTLVL